jgi:hypothetical protein
MPSGSKAQKTKSKAKTKPKKVTLKNVRLHGVRLKDQVAFVMDGVVKNHPKLPDGYITTSVIKWINFEDSTVQTKNTLYHIKWGIV